MTIRLNKKTREVAVAAATDAKFDKVIKKMREDVKSFCNTLAPKVYPPEIKEWVDKAPLGALDVKQVIYFKEWHKNGKDTVGISSEAVDLFSVLACDRYNTIKVILTKADAEKLKALINAVSEILEQRSTFKTLITGAIFSCTTLKQLHEHYPEIAKYLPKEESNSKQLAITSKNVAEAFNEKVPKG